MKRVRLKKQKEFEYDDDKVKFFSSGCTLLDCTLGGGWALGRIGNIVGDRSTAKTGLAMEAFANFEQKFKKGNMYFQEAEAAWDMPYAKRLGFPDDAEVLPFAQTVEEFNKQLHEIANGEEPKLVVLDSLDALSDRREQERDIDKGQDYNTGKALQMSAMFRKLRGRLARTNTSLIVISQVRDKINVTFGKKQTRSGGRALDFYASQVIWLSIASKKWTTVKKIKRATGVNIKAYCDKNKVGRPFRECEFPYIFEYGADDDAANLKYLRSIGVKIPRNMSEEDAKELVIQTWDEIEDGFTPKRSKYS